MKKLADYFGALRTVVFCTEDLQLVKGTARARRRFMDLLLAQTQPSLSAVAPALHARRPLPQRPAQAAHDG